MTQIQGRAAATTAAIEQAALDLVLAHGYEHVTVDMICDVAGISQRTFFNHFPAKDDALLGRDLPRIDERAARRFVIADGPILVDALSLITLPPVGGPRLEERFRVISASPSLMSRQMERIGAIEAELQEIIGLRLERERPRSDEDERRQDAAMVTHLLAGVMRFMGTSNRDADARLPEVLDRTRSILQRVLSVSAVD